MRTLETPALPRRHPHPASPLKEEGEWSEALAAFYHAQAGVVAIEGATAGGSVEEEEAWLPRHEGACGVMEAALARAVLARVPDLAAFTVKLELLFAQAVEPGAVEEAFVAAVLGDVRGLVGG